MYLENPESLNSLAKSLSLLGGTRENESLPRDFLNLDGFKLNQAPKRKLRALFLGAVSPWGEQKVRLCPRLEWIFHESDLVVVNLKGHIASGAIGSLTRQHISLGAFNDLCEQLIPEKLHVMMGASLVDSKAENTLRAIDYLGAKPILASEMVRLSQGLFLEVQRHACEVRAQKDLARLEMGSGKFERIHIRNKKMLADNLGNFISTKDQDMGMAAQLEFSLYDDWLLERVKWHPLQSQKSSSFKTISARP